MATITLETVDGTASAETNQHKFDAEGPEFGASRIYGADGWLNGYALAIGYSERCEGVVLYRSEESLWWVRDELALTPHDTYEAAKEDFIGRVKAQLALGL